MTNTCLTLTDIICKVAQGGNYSTRKLLNVLHNTPSKNTSCGLILIDEESGEKHVFSTICEFFRVIDWVSKNSDMEDNPLCQIYLDSITIDIDILRNYYDVPTGTAKTYYQITISQF